MLDAVDLGLLDSRIRGIVLTPTLQCQTSHESQFTSQTFRALCETRNPDPSKVHI